MPSGGTLTISTSNVTVGRDAAGVPALVPGKFVQLTVTDTGTGMTEEVRSHMFEPFYTTKASGKGTGLGLSTVYGIVQQSGGHILVETEKGKGTSLRILLPAVEGEAAPAQEPCRAGEMPHGTETILLVEDQARSTDAGGGHSSGSRLSRAGSRGCGTGIGIRSASSQRRSHRPAADRRGPCPASRRANWRTSSRASRREIKILLMSGYTNPAGGQQSLSERGTRLARKAVHAMRARPRGTGDSGPGVEVDRGEQPATRVSRSPAGRHGRVAVN